MSVPPDSDVDLLNSYKRQNERLAYILTQMLQEKGYDNIQDELKYIGNNGLKLLDAINACLVPLTHAKALLVL